MMDPSGYIKSNRLQLESAREFIESLVPSASDWCLELVLDIGCGPGNTSTYWIDHYFPNIGRLIGIDVDPGMIALAKRENKKQKIDYYVADIMNKESLREWQGSVTAVFSTYVFHRVTDQRQAFKNVFDLLKPLGEVAICFILGGAFYLAFLDLLKMTKWKAILESSNLVIPESYIQKYDVTHYKQMFEEIGFKVSLCITKPLVFAYDTDEECKNLLMSLHSVEGLSNELKEEYKEALFEQFLKHSPRDSKGRPMHNATALHVKLHKKLQ